MKKSGFVRKVDELGRIVIPKEIRKELKINEGMPLEISAEKGAVLFRKAKYENCTICGQVVDIGDKYCRNCGNRLEEAK